ncbi:MAG: hypothetical protein KJP07_13620 [Desulfatitalea sp.]|nr:hypothetical protein [Desulfatitalea sp.]
MSRIVTLFNRLGSLHYYNRYNPGLIDNSLWYGDWVVEGTSLTSVATGLTTYLIFDVAVVLGKTYRFKYTVANNTLDGPGLGTSKSCAFTDSLSYTTFPSTEGKHSIDLLALSTQTIESIKLYVSGSNTVGTTIEIKDFSMVAL